MDEHRLVERALAGELGAFNQLVIAYQELAYSVAYRLLCDREAAAKAVQLSFIQAFRNLDSCRGTRFRNWLMRIVVKICSEHLHETPPARRFSGFDRADRTVPAQSASALGREENGNYLKLQEHLLAGIDALPDDLRTVLLLRDVQGFACEEIAEIDDVPVDNVRSRLCRARNQLRHHLVQNPEFGTFPHS